MDYTVLSLRPDLVTEVTKLLYEHNPKIYKTMLDINSKEELKAHFQKYYMDIKKHLPFALIMLDPDLDNKFVGIACAEYNESIANANGIWITNVYVIPEYRGTGVGNLMLEAVKSILVNNYKIKEVYLWTDGPKLTNFYKDLGFNIIIPQKKYEDFNLNIMKAELTPREPSLIQPVHVTGLIVIILIIILFKSILRFFYNLFFNWKMKSS